jgi:hypothetical protein
VSYFIRDAGGVPHYFNDDVSEDEANDLLDARETEPVAPPEEAGLGDIFGRGVDLGQGMAYGTVEAAGELLGVDALTEWGGEGRERNRAEAEAVQRSGGVQDIRGVGDAASWVAETVAEQVPLMAPSMAGGVAGAAIGTAIAPGLGTFIGGALGAFVPSFFLGVGETQGIIKEKGGTAPGAAFIGGTAIAALDSALPGKVGGDIVAFLTKKFGKEVGEEAAETVATKVLTKRMAVAAAGAKGMAVEGVTEAIQEAIGEISASIGTDTDIDWEGMRHQMIEAMAAGMLMGGGISAAVEALPKKQADAKKKNDGSTSTIEERPALLQLTDQRTPEADLYAKFETMQSEVLDVTENQPTHDMNIQPTDDAQGFQIYRDGIAISEQFDTAVEAQVARNQMVEQELTSTDDPTAFAEAYHGKFFEAHYAAAVTVPADRHGQEMVADFSLAGIQRRAGVGKETAKAIREAMVARKFLVKKGKRYERAVVKPVDVRYDTVQAVSPEGVKSYAVVKEEVFPNGKVTRTPTEVLPVTPDGKESEVDAAIRVEQAARKAAIAATPKDALKREYDELQEQRQKSVEDNEAVSNNPRSREIEARAIDEGMVEGAMPYEANPEFVKLTDELNARAKKYGITDPIVKLVDYLRGKATGSEGKRKRYSGTEGSYLDGVIQLAQNVWAPEHLTTAMRKEIFGSDPVTELSFEQKLASLSQILDHEAIHALKALGVFSDADWKALTKYVANAKFKGTGETYMQRAMRLYAPGGVPTHPSYANEDGSPNLPVIAEEAIADAFRYWMANGQKGVAGKPLSLFKRMLNFFRGVSESVSAVAGGEAVLGRIARGELGGSGAARAGPEMQSVRGGEMFSMREPNGLYSQASRAARTDPGKRTAQQWYKHFEKNNVKKAELDWVVGLDEFLKSAKSVNGEDLAAFIDQNGVALDEETRGFEEYKNVRDAINDAVSESLEANLAFRAAVRTYDIDPDDVSAVLEAYGERDPLQAEQASLPEEFLDAASDMVVASEYAHQLQGQSHEDLTIPKFAQYTLGEGNAENIREWYLTVPKDKSPANQLVEDWLVPRAHRIGDSVADNRLVVRIRTSDRTRADGALMLFIEEMQGDRQQAAREEGWRKPQLTADDVEVTMYTKTEVENAPPGHPTAGISSSLFDEHFLSGARERFTAPGEVPGDRVWVATDKRDDSVLTINVVSEQRARDSAVTTETDRRVTKTRAKVRELRRDARDVLRSVDNLGFDTVAEALGAVIEEVHWSNIWDASDMSRPDRKVLDDYRDYVNELSMLVERQTREAKGSGVGHIPFAKTDDWTSLALKRVLIQAVHEGYESIGWTTGDMQSERYTLEEKLTDIYYTDRGNGLYDVVAHRNPEFGASGTVEVFDQASMSRDEMAKIFGPELAEQIVKDEGKPADLEGFEGAAIENIEGAFLRGRGDGMRSYYDKIVGKNANTIGKKVGAKTRVAELLYAGEDEVTSPFVVKDNSGNILQEFRSYDNALDYVKSYSDAEQPLHVESYNETTSVWELPITDKLQGIVKGEGLQMFSMRDEPFKNQTPKEATFTRATTNIHFQRWMKRKHVGETPTFEMVDEYQNGPMFSLRPASVGFHSKLEQQVETVDLPGWRQKKGQNALPMAKSKEIWDKIKTLGIKKEEIKWTGIEDFLKTEDAFTRDEVLGFLRSNGLVLEERVADLSRSQFNANTHGDGEEGFDGEGRPYFNGWNWSESVIDDYDEINYHAESITENIEEYYIYDIARHNFIQENRERILQEVFGDNVPIVGQRRFDFAVGDLGGDVVEQSEFDDAVEEYVDENHKDEIVDSLEDAISEMASENYYDNPVIEMYDSTHNVRITGNNDQGWYNHDSGDMAYDLPEAETNALQHLTDNDRIGYALDEDINDDNEGTDAEVDASERPVEADVAQWGQYVMEGSHTNYREIKIIMPGLEHDYYKTSHHPDNKIIAFNRVTTRELRYRPKGEDTRGAIDAFVTVDGETYLQLKEQLKAAAEEEAARKEVWERRSNEIISEVSGFGDAAMVQEEVQRRGADGIAWQTEIVEKVQARRRTDMGYALSQKKFEEAKEAHDKLQGKAHAELARWNMQNPDMNAFIRTYFLDEAQSDLHQSGKRGYKTGADVAELRRVNLDATAALRAAVGAAVRDAQRDPRQYSTYLKMKTAVDGYGNATGRLKGAVWYHAMQGLVEDRSAYSFDKADGKTADLLLTLPGAKKKVLPLIKAWKKAADAEYAEVSGPPDAPFKDNAWIDLAVKRALIDAVANGYKAFGWPNAVVMEKRWSATYRKAYEYEYDQKIRSLISGLLGTKVHEFTLDGETYDRSTPFKQGKKGKKGRPDAPDTPAYTGSNEGDKGYYIAEIPDAVAAEIKENGFPMFSMRDTSAAPEQAQARAPYEFASDKALGRTTNDDGEPLSTKAGIDFKVLLRDHGIEGEMFSMRPKDAYDPVPNPNGDMLWARFKLNGRDTAIMMPRGEWYRDKDGEMRGFGVRKMARKHGKDITAVGFESIGEYALAFSEHIRINAPFHFREGVTRLTSGVLKVQRIPRGKEGKPDRYAFFWDEPSFKVDGVPVTARMAFDHTLTPNGEPDVLLMISGYTEADNVGDRYRSATPWSDQDVAYSLRDEDAANVKAIERPAIKYKGKIYRGEPRQQHSDIVQQSSEIDNGMIWFGRDADGNTLTEGFIVTREYGGGFVDRAEAFTLAVDAGQYDGGSWGRGPGLLLSDAPGLKYSIRDTNPGERLSQQDIETGQQAEAQMHVDFTRSQTEGIIASRLHQAGRNSKVVDWRIKLEDYMLGVKLMQEEVGSHGIRIEDWMNTYLEEQLHGSAAMDLIRNVDKDFIQPLTEMLKSNTNDVQLGDLEDYLYALHAPERNARLKEQGSAEDHPSGMSNADAAAHIARLRQEGKLGTLQTMNAFVKGIREESTRMRVESGLISQEMADEGRRLYPNYVPLRGYVDENADPDLDTQDIRARLGLGMDVRGRESRSPTGRHTEAKDILATLILQAEESSVRATKNNVGNAFLRFIKEVAAQDPAVAAQYATIEETVPVRAKIDGRTGRIYYAPDSLAHRVGDDIFITKVDGKEVKIRIKDPRVRRAMKREFDSGGGTLVQVLSQVNRFLASVNTSWNPEFLISNFARDMQTAGVVLQQYVNDVDGFKATAVNPKSIAKSLGAVKRILRGGEKGDAWEKSFLEFQKLGGTTEFLGIRNLQSVMSRIESELSDIGPRTPAKKAKAAFNSLASFVNDYNRVVENAARLAVFKALRDAGVSPKQAAFAAKNLTVNFNKGGEAKTLANSLYLFYNASLQGTFVLARGLRNKRVQKFVGGIVATGFMMDMMARMMWDDEDEDGKLIYDKIPDHILEHNIIIPWDTDPKGYKKIPLPYGFNAFYNTGRALSAYANGGKKGGETAKSIVMSAVDAFNPMGGTNSFINLVTPTILDPVVDLAVNEDFSGRNIVPERIAMGTRPAPPPHELYWNSTSTAWKTLATGVAELTGGSKGREGGIDFSPEHYEYVWDYFLGGVGKFVMRTYSLGESVTTGMIKDDFSDIEVGQIPFLRKVVGSVTNRENTSAYYENGKDVMAAKMEVDAYRKNQNYDAMRQVRKEYPRQLRLVGVFRSADRRLNNLRQQLARVRRQKGDLSARLKREQKIKDQMDVVINRTNRLYYAAMER